jgi:hypothetical protein
LDNGRVGGFRVETYRGLVNLFSMNARVSQKITSAETNAAFDQ